MQTLITFISKEKEERTISINSEGVTRDWLEWVCKQNFKELIAEIDNTPNPFHAWIDPK